MGKYLGPQHRACRRAGVKLCEKAKCPLTRRNYPPGQHGPKGYPRLTAYGLQLAEKQKAKRMYGIMERQFKNIIEKAQAKVGNTGEYLVNFLEFRLDNAVYRLGYALSRRQARQLVNHGHFLVNGKSVNIPSYTLRIGDTVSLKESSRTLPLFKNLPETLKSYKPLSWLSLDPVALIGKVVSEPAALKELKPLFDVKAVVEYYSR
jgi:small subunit ribosomal protein S4